MSSKIGSEPQVPAPIASGQAAPAAICVALTFRDFGTHIAAYDHRGEYQGSIISVGTDAQPMGFRIETIARDSISGRAYHLTSADRFPSIDDAKHALVAEAALA